MQAATIDTGAESAFHALLKNYSAELTARDHKSIAAAGQLPAGTEVFVASLPNDTVEDQVAACVALRRAGVTPVPHVVARNITNIAEMDQILARMTGEAGVDRALILGGDRDDPAGDFDSALQLIETGLIQRHGIRTIAISCYPEGHPRITDAVLEEARATKLIAAERAGLDVTLVSQFCFEAKPIIALTERMRALGVTAPYRVGVAGPAKATTLMKYALICGVGASMRALKERQSLTRNLLTGVTPEDLIHELAAAQAANPALGLSGIHFFTFGSLAASIKWIQGQIG